MKNLISLALIGLLLTGCIQRIPIEQGNIICENDVRLLRTGMSEDDVKAVMGNPVMVNLFTPNRMEYIYTYQLGNNRMTAKRLTLIFAGGRLRQIIR